MRLGGGAVAWRLTEIETWLDERAQKARSETTTPANEQ
jgi:predicted DNA-binding transcriptional regulator AlpA